LAQKGRFLTHRTQVSFFTLAVVLLLAASLFLSLDHAGIIHLKPETQADLPDDGKASLGYHVVNATDTQYIDPLVSSLVVQFTCIAANASHMHWDFGDGHGAEGVVVLYEYAEPGDYLVEATISFDNGENLIEYYYLTLDGDIVYQVNVPGVGNIWTFYTFSLLIAGIFSLIWFMITFYNRQRNGTHIWPRAFTPELRLFMGFGLIFCYFLAIGFFNGIIADFLSAVGV
jgi:hypothetical protein